MSSWIGVVTSQTLTFIPARTGFLTGLETNGVDAVLAPRPGQRCVELRTDGGHSPAGGRACAKD
ncbi:MAG TPA: hypothetical protein VK659_05970 [Asanoa sp.]|nr:hypothetical protein [Asanoa sp.]